MPENSPPTALTGFSVKLITNFALLFFGVAGAQAQYTILDQQPVSNRPYPSAYYNQQLPNAGAGGPLNHLMPNSPNVVNTVMTNGTGSLLTGSGAWNTPGLDDQQHRPVYYGKSSDPVYQVSGCVGTGANSNGQKFHAPAGALYKRDVPVLQLERPSKLTRLHRNPELSLLLQPFQWLLQRGKLCNRFGREWRRWRFDGWPGPDG
jgi:hypothetical protein